MATSADRYQDALLQHGVELQGVSNSLATQMITILNRSERELIAQLREGAEALGVGPGNSVLTRKQIKLEEMLTAIVLLRDVAWKQLHGSLRTELVSIAKFEAAFNQKALTDAIAILEVRLGTPTAAQLRRIVNQAPFLGKTLRGWTDSIALSDVGRLRDTIINAIAEGASVEELVRRVRGTRQQNFTDGILQTSRVATANVVRTAISHVSNGAREEFFAENADFFNGMVWISTLDGRTSRICATLDGQIAPPPGRPLAKLPAGRTALKPPGRRPPAHPGGCRSLMGAWLNGVEIVGNRPFVTSTLNRREREINFRKNAKQKAGAAEWSNLSRTQRNARARAERTLWANENIGSLPLETTFKQFFDRTSVSFQEEWLGATRFKLFKDGGVEINAFVDLQTGKQLTIEQLLRTNRPAFEKAGLL